MAHFAKIDQNNNVESVVRVSDEQENRGNEYLSNDLGLGGTWIQCSYNGNIRKQFPGVGYTYDPDLDIFIAPRPFIGWELDENFDWQPPIPYPDDGQMYAWSEVETNWILVEEE